MTRAGIGIDPGQRGGIARRTAEGTVALPADPWHDRLLDPRAADAALRAIGAEPGDLCYIEALTSRPGQSQRSGMTAQANHDTWVRAADDYGLTVSVKSTSRLDRLAGAPHGARRGGKGVIVALVQSACPEVDLTIGNRKVSHDGMADACLFALAAYRTVLMIQD